ncbi:MAG: sensor histidine kinase [Brevundimonas sp.]|jgi:two-component sensor histidine kinase|uniref:sensor histidine kinase n=1 Tax=Brevundimonas sp. TaxID=1871086 RepID=UPI0025B7F505|nr:sensor histidine kinase [Brevundimonas sp.]MCH4267295.1 sensor histidine kinase [Brevundimonas sp.]
MIDGAHDPVQAAHHQIGNSLQSVAAMLLRQGRGADPEVAPALFDASRRVRVIMRLHERLQIQNTGARVALDDLIRDICGDLAEIDASEEDRSLKLELARILAPASVASAVGLITAELASNALEHGLKDRSGVCQVQLSRSAQGCRLTVSDDGAGISDGEDLTAHEGFGLSLVRRLAGQIHGTLTVRRLSRGLGYQIDFPFPPELE